MRSMFRLGVLAATVSVSLAGLWGCSHEEPNETSDIQSIGNTTFTAWCASWGLQSCDLTPQTNMPSETWRAGVEIFGQIVRSPTRINLSRADFARDSVKTLINTFGGSGIFAILNQMPWQTMSLSDGRITLKNSQAGSWLEFNGLRLIASTEVVVVPNGAYDYTTSGLTMSGPRQPQPYTVRNLDFSDVGVIHMGTNLDTIRDIPIGFFSFADQVEPVNPAPAQIIRALTQVATDPELNWREKIRVTLIGSYIRDIFEIVKEIMPDSPLNDSLSTLLDNSKSLIVGGGGTQIVSLSLFGAMNCKFKAHNIPILGTVNVELRFGNGMGLYDLTQERNGTAAAKIYGVDSNYGTIRQITFEEQRARLQIGSLSIPFDYAGSGSSRVDAMVCVPKP